MERCCHTPARNGTPVPYQAHDPALLVNAYWSVPDLIAYSHELSLFAMMHSAEAMHAESGFSQTERVKLLVWLNVAALFAQKKLPAGREAA